MKRLAAARVRQNGQCQWMGENVHATIAMLQQSIGADMIFVTVGVGDGPQGFRSQCVC